MSAATFPAAGTSIMSLRLCPPNNSSFFITPRIPSSGYSNYSTGKQHVVFCSLLKSEQQASEGVVGCIGTGRREAMLQMAFSAVVQATTLAISSPARAVEDVSADYRLYSDDVNKYNISIPQDWEVGFGESDGIRSITAFYPGSDKAAASNVSVAITGIGPDFTRLESFGKVDEFAESLVNGLDRSWQRPAGVAAKLVDCKAKNGFYYIEYTLQNPGEVRRHIYSKIGMARSEWYNRLFTVTGQFVDDEEDKYSSKIEKVVQSFRFS